MAKKIKKAKPVKKPKVTTSSSVKIKPFSGTADGDSDADDGVPGGLQDSTNSI